ncbi:MAG TPA: nucleoside triphosphate pyrophosphohydrolase [Abditibacteriaceae bacterium]|nr:nucleoside triphosphate pyrophosphohydrolase [Abditibacteriaceae bacterium]
MNPKRTATQEFERLTQIIAQLRAPDGCPWDREQTHRSLRASLIEETAETLDAIERANDADLREELGDLLMQPIFHAQIAGEENRFDLADVLHEICEKLVRRHPHVFGDAQVENTAGVLANWDAIKKQEKAAKAAQNSDENSHRVLDAAPDSVLSNIPPELPALALAMKVSKKAAKAGFEWEDLNGVLDKLREELQEFETEIEQQNRERATEELGDLLFTLVNVARWKKIDPELALRDTVSRFTTRFHAMESEAQARDLKLEDLSPAQWDELWNRAKSSTRSEE